MRGSAEIMNGVSYFKHKRMFGDLKYETRNLIYYNF